jgi:hypothetical protein
MINPAGPSPRYTGLLGPGGLTTGANVGSTNANYYMIFGRKAFFGYEVSDEGHVSWFANLPHRDLLTLAQLPNRRRRLGNTTTTPIGTHPQRTPLPDGPDSPQDAFSQNHPVASQAATRSAPSRIRTCDTRV